MSVQSYQRYLKLPTSSTGYMISLLTNSNPLYWRGSCQKWHVISVLLQEFVRSFFMLTVSVCYVRNQLHFWSLEDRRKTNSSVSWHGLSRMKISMAPIQNLWRDYQRQTAGDSNHLRSFQMRSNLNIDQEKHLPHKCPATNYLWNALRKQPITLKYQNSATISNPDANIVETRGLSIGILVAAKVLYWSSCGLRYKMYRQFTWGLRHKTMLNN